MAPAAGPLRQPTKDSPPPLAAGAAVNRSINSRSDDAAKWQAPSSRGIGLTAAHDDRRDSRNPPHDRRLRHACDIPSSREPQDSCIESRSVWRRQSIAAQRAPFAWGWRHFSRPPSPVWTFPTIACPPPSTFTCCTVTVCLPPLRCFLSASICAV